MVVRRRSEIDWEIDFANYYTKKVKKIQVYVKKNIKKFVKYCKICINH